MTRSKLLLRFTLASALGLALVCFKLIQPSSNHIETNIIAAHNISMENNTSFSYSMPRIQNRTVSKNFAKKTSKSIKHYLNRQSKKKTTLNKVFTKKWTKKDFLEKKKKTAKKDAKKKKTKKTDKKKLTAESSKQNTDPQAEREKEFDAVDKGSYVSSDNDQPQQGTAALPTDDSGESEDAISFDEWKTLLLSNPNRKNTALFIDSYSSQQISDEDFYQLIIIMIESSEPSVRQQGIISLNAITSARSFELMAHYYELEPTDSTLRNDMRTYLDQYASISRLSILKQTLQSNTDAVIVETVQLLRKIALYHQTTSGGDDIVSMNNERLLLEFSSSFIPLLENLQHGNNNVTQAIEITLTTLNNFVSDEQAS